MKKRWIALALVPALVLSLGMVTAMAGEETAKEVLEHAKPGVLIAPNPNAAAADGTEEPVSPPEPSAAGPDADVAMGVELDPETKTLMEKVTTKPTAVESVSFDKLEQLLRKGSLPLLAIEENVVALETMDYKQLEKDLRNTLNNLADAQWGMVQASKIDPNDPYMGQYYREFDSYSFHQVGQVYGSIEEQFDAIYKGEMQEDNAGVTRQLKNLQDQIIMGGESLYTALAAMEIQAAALQRQLAAVNRTVEEMDLRYQMGQISALQLSQTKAGQASLASGLETLRMNIRTYKSQLEMMLGAEITGEIMLGAVPAVTEAELAAMDVEKDLLTAKAKSYELYAAAKALEAAKEEYDDACEKYHFNEKQTMFRTAKHTWQAEQYTYNDTIRNYELQFRTLHAQVLDFKQILDAAKVSLESEKLDFAAAELKHQQGTVSRNAFLTAQDELKAAEEKVQTAANDLFSAYNTYCWAVQHGILN